MTPAACRTNGQECLRVPPNKQIWSFGVRYSKDPGKNGRGQCRFTSSVKARVVRDHDDDALLQIQRRPIFIFVFLET